MKSETEISDPESLIKFIDECGIIPHRMIDITPCFGPTFVSFQFKCDTFLEAFFEYMNNSKDYHIRNFENIRFEDVFSDDEEFIYSMTAEGTVDLISNLEPRLGAYRLSYEKYGFFYQLDFKLLEAAFSRKMPDFEFFHFAEFMNEYADYWSAENPKLNSENFADNESNYSQKQINIFCEFANFIFGFYEKIMGSFSRQWHCIEYSQDPFYFSLGKGVYNILFVSKSRDSDVWEFIEFVCDY